jgi:hypothetical protein
MCLEWILSSTTELLRISIARWIRLNWSHEPI